MTMKKKRIIFLCICLLVICLIIFRYNQVNKPAKVVSFQTIKIDKEQEIKAKNGINLHVEKVSRFKNKEDGLDYYKILIFVLNESNNEVEINTNHFYLSNDYFSTSLITGVNPLQENEEIKFGTRINVGPQKMGKYEIVVPIFSGFYIGKEKSKDIYFNYKVIDIKSNTISEYKIKL